MIQLPQHQILLASYPGSSSCNKMGGRSLGTRLRDCYLFWLKSFTYNILHSLQQQYALLLACVAQDRQWYCVIRPLEMMTALGNPITNDFECPLLTLTDTVLLVPPHRVQTSVSIVHQCTDTCTFTDTGIRRRIEREEVHIRSCNLLYKHDWSNNLYCLNIFCMNQWPYFSLFLYTCIVPTAFKRF